MGWIKYATTEPITYPLVRHCTQPIPNPYTISLYIYTQWQIQNAPRHKLNDEDPARQRQENTNTMVEVNLRHECALRAITHAGTPDGMNDYRTGIGTADATMGVMIVGVGEESIASAIERRRGIMIGSDMRIQSRRSRERMYVSWRCPVSTKLISLGRRTTS